MKKKLFKLIISMFILSCIKGYSKSISSSSVLIQKDDGIQEQLLCAFKTNNNTKPIPSGEFTRSIINIEDDFIIGDVNVTINLEHVDNGDFSLELIGPDGTRIELKPFQGGEDDSENMIGTVFDDQANISISNGTGPYTGNFKPFESLSVFNGLMSAGDWKLKISDLDFGGSGTLNSWSLEICDAPTIEIICENYINEESAEIPERGVYQSIITVTDNFIINDINLSLNLEHPSVNELKLELISPDNEKIILGDIFFYDGSNFINTIFDDQGDEFIFDGMPPFTGTFKPEDAFSTLTGGMSGGNWRLKITDEDQENAGTLNSWSLEICGDGGSTLSVSNNIFVKDSDFSVTYKHNKKFMVHMSANYSNEEVANITILSALGQKITNVQFIPKGLNFSHILDLSFVPSGIYFLNLNKGSINQTKRIIVR